jgi:hypothetical protein
LAGVGMKIKELLTDESKWTQNAGARDKEKIPVPPKSEEAVCWCLFGAILKCYGEDKEVYNRLDKYILYNLTGMGIFSYNDNPKRTFKDIKALIEKLDI